MKALSNNGLTGCLSLSKVWKKSENQKVVFINHVLKCDSKLSVTFNKASRAINFIAKLSSGNCRCKKLEVKKKLLQFDDLIREDKQDVILNIWKEPMHYNVGCFIELMAFEDEEDEIEIGGIDFNVIGFSDCSNRRL